MKSVSAARKSMTLPLPSSPQRMPTTHVVGMDRLAAKAPEHTTAAPRFTPFVRNGDPGPSRASWSADLESLPPVAHSGAENCTRSRRMNASEQTRRVEALALLEVFTKRILPGAIRRIAAWKGIRRGQIPDLTDELHQELAVDCLLHADTVVRLPTSERHTRWMRAADRWIYHHRVGRNKNTLTPDAPLAARGPGVAETDLVARHSIVAMGNGRLNLAASAASGRKEARRLRQELEVLATELGCDEQYL